MLNKRDRASESERASERARESGERDFIRNNAHGGSWARSGDRRCIALCGQREHPHRVRGTQKRTSDQNPERTIARTRRNRVESRRSRMNKEKEKRTGDERNEREKRLRVCNEDVTSPVSLRVSED